MNGPIRNGLIERLAAWAVAIDDIAVSGQALRQAKLLVLDCIGCALLATADETGRAILAYAEAAGGSPQCSVVGMKEKTSVQNAVLTNGVLVRTLDLNDYVVDAGGDMGGHPSDIIPTALAVAEAQGRSGREALAAIVIGYEVYGRLKSSLEKRSSWDGVCVTGGVAPILAGRLMGFDGGRLAHALALGLSYCAVSAVVRTGEISAAKNLANAWVAEHGVRSALLAARGVTGPLDIFEDRLGMKAVFPRIDQERQIDAPFPEDTYILHSSIKIFPCISTAQALVSASIALHEDLRGSSPEIFRILIEMADQPIVRRQQDDLDRRRPASREAADHSFPFLAAVALLDGRLNLESFVGERWFDPDVQALMQRMEMTTSGDLSRRSAPRSFPAAVEIELSDGRRLRREVATPPGYGGASLDESTVHDKFLAASEDALGRAGAQRVLADIMGMDDGRPCARIFDGVCGEATG